MQFRICFQDVLPIYSLFSLFYFVCVSFYTVLPFQVTKDEQNHFFLVKGGKRESCSKY